MEQLKTTPFKFAGILLTLFILSGCATLLSGPNQNVWVSSEPKGADVYVNNQPTNKVTPCYVKTSRRIHATANNDKNELNIKVEKPGFLADSTNDNAGLNPTILLNGFIGFAPFFIDLATGAHLRYDRRYKFNLTAKTIPAKGPIQTSPQPIMAKESSNTQPTHNLHAKKATSVKPSDIDLDLPENINNHPYRFALIIGNEDYTSYQPNLNAEVNVDFARHDAETFKNYLTTLLGVPEGNVIFMTDATYIEMKRGLNKLNLLAKNSMGKAELIFYYAGHGLPHEVDKAPYLLPVDVPGTEINLAIKLSDVYQTLNEYPTKRVTCFLDCCFSGGARNAGLVASRGVKVVPKLSPVKGNMTVFSASSKNQSAMAYHEKNHGLFTYYLLKKLKETKGKATYGELSEYLKIKVPLTSILINNKEQNPQVNVSPELEEDWLSFTF